jgi:hypothetical protein
MVSDGYRIAVVLGLLAAPFLTTVAAGALARWAASRGDVDAGGPAGDFLERRARAVPGLRIGVTPHEVGPVDAYWPAVGFLGLAPATWSSDRASARAVAAHELGHALARWGPLPELLRMVSTLAWHVFGASLLVLAVTGEARAVSLAYVGVVVSVVAGVFVLADEVAASVRGARLLREDWRTSMEVERVAWRAFVGSAATYAAPWLTRVVIALSLGGWAAPLVGPSDRWPMLGTLWVVAVLACTPFLLVRVIQVVAEVGWRAPARSDFHVAWTSDRERVLETRTSLVLLIWLALCPASPIDTTVIPLLVLGLVPAMGPLGGLGRALFGLPLAFVRAPAPAYGPASELLVLVPEHEPAWFRAASLVRIAYVPLLIVLVARAIPAVWYGFLT